MVQPGKADDWHDEALEDDPGAREYRHLQQRFTTLGFVDGVEAAQEAAMQSGFNDGFQTASADAVEGGVLVGIIRRARTHRSAPLPAGALSHPHSRHSRAAGCWTSCRLAGRRTEAPAA